MRSYCWYVFSTSNILKSAVSNIRGWLQQEKPPFMKSNYWSHGPGMLCRNSDMDRWFRTQTCQLVTPFATGTVAKVHAASHCFPGVQGWDEWADMMTWYDVTQRPRGSSKKTWKFWGPHTVSRNGQGRWIKSESKFHWVVMRWNVLSCLGSRFCDGDMSKFEMDWAVEQTHWRILILQTLLAIVQYSKFQWQ